jgi:hypothetical protein
MELVGGPTLADCLKQSSIPISEARQRRRIHSLLQFLPTGAFWRLSPQATASKGFGYGPLIW